MDADDVFDVREVAVAGIGRVWHARILLIREEMFPPVKKRHVGSPSSFMRPRLRTVRMDSLLRKECDVFDMEGLQSSQEFRLVRLRESVCQGQKDFSGFGDWPHGHIPDHNLLHVELAHLEWYSLKNPWQSKESVGRDREDGVSQSFEKILSFTVVVGSFVTDVLPPQILFSIRVAEQDHSPSGLVDPRAEICRVDDQMDRSRFMLLFGKDDLVQVFEYGLPVVSGLLFQFSDRLLPEYITVPQVIMIASSSRTPESAIARPAPICLHPILYPSFNDVLKTALRAIFSFFVGIGAIKSHF